MTGTRGVRGERTPALHRQPGPGAGGSAARRCLDALRFLPAAACGLNPPTSPDRDSDAAAGCCLTRGDGGCRRQVLFRDDHSTCPRAGRVEPQDLPTPCTRYKALHHSTQAPDSGAAHPVDRLCRTGGENEHRSTVGAARGFPPGNGRRSLRLRVYRMPSTASRVPCSPGPFPGCAVRAAIASERRRAGAVHTGRQAGRSLDRTDRRRPLWTRTPFGSQCGADYAAATGRGFPHFTDAQLRRGAAYMVVCGPAFLDGSLRASRRHARCAAAAT